jgi:hypothetical protein
VIIQILIILLFRFLTDISITIIQVVGRSSEIYMRWGKLTLAFIPDLPKTGPKILGVKSSYHVGDRVTATCISPKSYPPSVLTWYINSDSADPKYVSSQSEALFHFTNQSDKRIRPNNFEEHVLRLKSRVKTNRQVNSINGQKFPRVHHHLRSDPNLYSVVKLRFPIKENHLVTEDRELSLKCAVSVTDLYWRSVELNMLISRRHGWMFNTSNRAKNEQFQQLILKCALILSIMYFWWINKIQNY